MDASIDKTTLLATKVRVPHAYHQPFADWQAQLNGIIASFKDFISLEVVLSSEPKIPTWMIVQRFQNVEALQVWKNSQERQELMEALQKILPHQELPSVEELESEIPFSQGVITEVFVTRIAPDKEKAYRDWISKIHQAEAKFPGFRGMYLQSPKSGEGENWITLLQFDTQENLERWLSSSERKKILDEAETLILSFEKHRVISPYAGWFSSIAKQGEIPSPWKQSMIVLLLLFPIVMLEGKYLTLLTSGLNPSLAMFISNAISVSLLAWPFVPWAIKCLRWWLQPSSALITFFGFLLILVLYLLEIALFW